MQDERDPYIEQREPNTVEQLSNTYLDSIKNLKSAKQNKAAGKVTKYDEPPGVVQVPAIPLRQRKKSQDQSPE